MRWIEKRLVNSWLESCCVSRVSERMFRYDLLMYERHLAARGVIFEETTREDVESFLKWLEAEHAPTVAYHAVKTVMRFYEWADESGFYKNVAKRVGTDAVRKACGARALIQAEHVGTLLSACGDDRERALVALLTMAALRPREIEGACLGDVRLDEPLPRVMVARSAAYLTPACADVIRSYLEARAGSGEDPLFVSQSLRSMGGRLSMRSIRQIVREVYVRSGIPGSLGSCDLAGAAVGLAVESGAEPAIIAAIATRCAELGRFRRDSTTPSYRPPE